MHFVIAVGLRIVVDIVFQFHFKWCFDYCSKIETGKRLFLWETVKALLLVKNLPVYIIPLSLQKATSCSFLVKFRASLISLSFFSTLLNPDGFIWCF